MATIYDRLKIIIVDQLGVEESEVNPAAKFADDLGADSLDLVELIMAIEENFSTPEKKVEIPDNDAEKIVTVQDAVDYIKKSGYCRQLIILEMKRAQQSDLLGSFISGGIFHGYAHILVHYLAEMIAIYRKSNESRKSFRSP